MESMRERLERIRNTPAPEKPPLREERSGPMITHESVFMKKIDKMISQIEGLKKQMMADSSNYLVMYSDLRQAEKEFLDAINDPEIPFMNLPDIWVQRVNETKNKILQKR